MVEQLYCVVQSEALLGFRERTEIDVAASFEFSIKLSQKGSIFK